MGCLPYFKFYPDDWLSDRRVRMMSPEARGVYWDLLATAWKEGGIPDDPRELAGWLGVTQKRFARIWSEVECHWVHGPEGKLVNVRQEQEREKAQAVYRQRVEAGKLGGRPAAVKANGKP